MTITRRAMVGLSAAAVFIPLRGAVAQPLHGIVVENGTLASAGFTVGMLSCNDPAAEAAALESLRLQTRYHRKNFGYRSTDRSKIPYFRAAMTRFVQSPDLQAHTVRVENVLQGAAVHERRLEVYRQLLATMPDGATASLHLAQRSSDSRDARLAADLQRLLGIGSWAAVDGANHGALVQFASALFGSIKSDRDHSGVRTGISMTKAKMMDAAQQALGVPDLGYETLARTGKFRMAIIAG